MNDFNKEALEEKIAKNCNQMLFEVVKSLSKLRQIIKILKILNLN